MTVRILGVYPQESYNSKIDGVIREDHQEFKVDVGTIVSKPDAVTAFLSDRRIPIPFQAHPSIAGMYANPIAYVQDKEVPNVWNIQVVWKTITDITQTIKDPTDRPVLITTGTYKQQVIPNVDYNGKPICTTAGEPINYQQQKGYPTYTFSKKLKNYPTAFSTIRDMVNADLVTIFGIDFPPYSLFCPDVQISHLLYEGNYPFYQFDATVYVNFELNGSGEFIGWRTLIRNAGYHERRLTGFEKDKNGKSNKKKPLYEFVTIKMGRPGEYSYPASPILLTPGGTAYRRELLGDKTLAIASGATAKDIAAGNYAKTGEVIGIRQPGDPATSAGISQKQWDAAVIEVSLTNVIEFNGNFPLR